MNILESHGAKIPKQQLLSMTIMMLACELLLSFSSLGYIVTDKISITTLHIPVLLVGMFLGTKPAILVSLIFGVTSVWQAQVSGINEFDIIFSPFRSGNFLASVILAIGTRAAFAYYSGKAFSWLFNLPHKFHLPGITIITLLSCELYTASVFACIAYFFPHTGIGYDFILEYLNNLNNVVMLTVTVMTIGMFYSLCHVERLVAWLNRISTECSEIRNRDRRYSFFALIVFNIIAILLYEHFHTRLLEALILQGVTINTTIAETMEQLFYQAMAAADGAIIILIELVIWASQYYAGKLEQINLLEREMDQEKANNKIRIKFMNSLAHDIRTPLNAIIGFIRLSIDNADNKEKQGDYLSKTLVASNFLLHLINDVLDFSRLNSGKLKLQPVSCDLVKIFRDTEAIIKSQLEAKKQSFSVEFINVSQPHVLADPLRLNQILLNLLGNSVKFTPEKGEIFLRLQQIKSKTEGYGRYVIYVKDNGIGMSSEFAEKVFDPFSRDEEVVKNIQGTGLGMAIVKNLVDMMNGDIRVISEAGKGTEFIIRLDIPIDSNQAEEVKVQAQSEEQQSFNGVNLLLADDNEMNQEIAAAILLSIGIEPDIVNNGEQAVEAVCNKDKHYDLIFMDIHMPVMNGLEAARRIRSMEDKAIREIPIYAMTADTSDETRNDMKLVGINGYVTKPFNVEEFVKTLQKVINR